MKLFSAGASPFGRKVKLALYVLDMINDVDIIATDTSQPDTENRKLNPLGKIPTLLTDEQPIYDSRVIMDHLDRLAGGNKLFPASGAERTKALTDAALMDGIMEAAILIVYEGRMRPEGMQVQSIIDYQRDKIIRALTAIEAGKPAYQSGAMPNAAEIALACVVDYLDLRAIIDWRQYAPSLVDYMMDFSKSVPGYHESLPEGVPAANWR